MGEGWNLMVLIQDGRMGLLRNPRKETINMKKNSHILYFLDFL